MNKERSDDRSLVLESRSLSKNSRLKQAIEDRYLIVVGAPSDQLTFSAACFYKCRKIGDHYLYIDPVCIRDSRYDYFLCPDFVLRFLFVFMHVVCIA